MAAFRVLQLISSGGFYGAENMVIRLSHALKQFNCEIVVGVFRNAHRANTEVAEKARECGLEVELIECRGRFDAGTVKAIQNCLSRRQISILHAHGYKADFYGYRAVHGAGIGLVATCHNWPAKTAALRFYAFWDRLLLRRFDHISAVSGPVAESLRRFGVPQEKVTIVQNGIDVAHYAHGRPVLRNNPELRGKRIVGYVGRLAREKGVRILLHAAPPILASNPDVTFVLVGDGPDRRTLENMTRQLGIERNVSFLGQRSDLPDMYASFDIFVLPSLGEGMPLAVLEAMAAGRPVVATNVGAVPKIVRNRESGLLVEAGDVKGLQSAICYLLDRHELRSELGLCGHATVRAHFSSEQMAEAYLRIYSRFESSYGSVNARKELTETFPAMQ